MYVSDLPDPSHAESLTIQYADDVTLLSRARTLDSLTDRLQIELTESSLWEAKWRILSHPDKANITYYNIKGHAPRQLFLNPFLPNQPPIRRTHTTKILGVLLDDKLTLQNHISSKAAMAKNTLSNLERFRGCDQRTKLHLYKALVRPTITYCPLILSLASKNNIIKLQRVQNKALRFCFNTHWREFRRSQDLHDSAEIEAINTTLHTRKIKQLLKFQLTHETTIEYVNSLPPFRRGYPTVNLLLPDNHEQPVPLYT